MSGICGIFHYDNRPAGVGEIGSLTEFLAFRGPDAQQIWSNGSVALGHAMLRTIFEASDELQPACFDGRFWITADSRIDARADLVANLRAKGLTCSSAASDSEVILRAYAAWGEDCVDHLIGDFAFGIWDSVGRKLFCARDRMGLKPFYHASIDGAFVFSNTLDCVRQSAGISEELNESAIADFLLFGTNCDPATTFFADIHSLPPGHTISVSSGGVKFRRYWSPPTNGEIRYRKPTEYVDHFRHIFDLSVRDCMRCKSAGIMLSGGLDSSSVAAIAAANRGETELRAYNAGYDYLIPDRDKVPAQVVADHLGIPLERFTLDKYRPFQDWNELQLPEPVEDPLCLGRQDFFQFMGNRCRVVMSGEGNDNLMDFQLMPFLGHLAQRKKWGRAAKTIATYIRLRRFPYQGILFRFNRLLGKAPGEPAMPEWFDPRFAARMHLRERSQEVMRSFRVSDHPVLPRACASLSMPFWALLFNQGDAATTQSLLEVRYPFLDVRVINFLLALPPIPWFMEKRLLRSSMRALLPADIICRPKQALQADPLTSMLRLSESQWIQGITATPIMKRYVDWAAIPEPGQGQSRSSQGVNLRPQSLNFWLQSLPKFRYNHKVEAVNG